MKKISEDDLERITKIFTIVKEYQTDGGERQNTKNRKLVITKSVMARREPNTKNQYIII